MKIELRSKVLILMSGLLDIVKESIVVPPTLVDLIKDYPEKDRELIMNMYSSKLSSIVNHGAIKKVIASGSLSPGDLEAANHALHHIENNLEFGGEEAIIDMVMCTREDIREDMQKEPAPV